MKKNIPSISFLLLFFFKLFFANAQNVPIKILIESNVKLQTIDNLGASSGWFTEFVGRYWAKEQRESMARWLFSTKMDENGNPEGIGLSSFRFNIGGGTAELGNASKIDDFRRRVECFLDSSSCYDWTKQSGCVWFLKMAKKYGVEHLIAFSNTPPVSMTQNGLGYKTLKDYTSNLKKDKYPAFASFLSHVLRHFDSVGLHFDYVSPVNEPQWDWYNNSQEGSPWSNIEISKVVRTLDSTMTSDRVRAKIILPEAGHLEYLYTKEGKAGSQIQSLYNNQNPLRINSLPNVLNVVGGHSYYTDGDDSFRINVRKALSDTVKKYGTEYWQTEYSMLGDNYKEGRQGKVSALDCALFLSKVIHDDLVYGNATAWQFWNSCEPGNTDFDTRYYLLALSSDDPKFEKGVVLPAKMLWAMGNYSRFVRPGMQRVKAEVSDGKDEISQAQDVMVSAFENQKHIVCVLVNYTNESKKMRPVIMDCSIRKKYVGYITDGQKNLASFKGCVTKRGIELPQKSVVTIVFDKSN